MKLFLLALFTLGFSAVRADTDVRIPESYLSTIRTTDLVEVSGTNDLGGAEKFGIHNAKAIGQFIEFLTSDRYTAVPKNLKPQFKSLSAYSVRLSTKGTTVLEVKVIADSILDIPSEPVFYMQSDRYSDNIMAPLLRLR